MEFISTYYIFYILAFLAEIVGTVSGFGSSIIFVPLASLFFDFQTVLGITALFHVFSNLSKIALFRKGIDKKIVLKLGIPAVIFVIIGAFLTQLIPVKELELAMNVVLVILAVILIAYADKGIEQSDRNLVTGGAASGFLAGLIGTGGSIRGVTLASFNLKKEVFVATSAVIDLGVDFSRTVVYAVNGYIGVEYFIVILPLIPLSFLGSLFGKIILDKFSQKSFKYMLLVVIIGTSVFQLYKYFFLTQAS